MTNQRLTHKDKTLIKGALRRVFARSELHKAVLDRASTSHSDPSRMRVKRWGFCEQCGVVDARSYFDVDHIEPVVPIKSSLVDMTIVDLINRTWCPLTNLQALCKTCHDAKSKAENKLRREFKKGKGKNG